MTQNLPNEAPTQARPSRPQVRAKADESLRDIALVLKMTQRIRAEIEAEKEAEELVLA
jgi:hypothetical protein